MSRPQLRRDLAAIKRGLDRSSERPAITQTERDLRENEAVYTKVRRAVFAFGADVLEQGGRAAVAARLRRAVDDLREWHAVTEDITAAWNALDPTQREEMGRKLVRPRREFITAHVRWMMRDADRRGVRPEERGAYLKREWSRLAGYGILPSLEKPTPSGVAATGGDSTPPTVNAPPTV